ncbi:MAG: DNRLRE domain-containing protein [Planctomycetota bacterium]
MRYGLFFLLTVAAWAGNDAQHWVYFEARESSGAALLEIETTAGAVRVLPADADTVLIGYLANKAWGGNPRLSVQIGDQNRVLLRFDDLPAGETVKLAELVLTMALPKENAPREPFELVVHRVKGAWSEANTTWDSQPPAHEPPDVTVRVEPKAQVLRVDVTKALRAGARHGLLIKVPGPVRRIGSRLDEILPFERHTGAALQRARDEKKQVLALVGASTEPDFGEVTLIATAFAHPAVRDAVKRRFVPVRVSYRSHDWVNGDDAKSDLRDLGTTMQKAKAPALVIATARGKHVRTLEAIGTFDHGALLEFLGEEWTSPEPAVALLRKGEFAAAETALRAAKSDEARYWLGALLWRTARRDEARALWKAVPGDSAWRWKADARLEWPDRIGMAECLRAPAGWGATTEAKADVGRGLDYLESTQAPDGSWQTADGTGMYRAAVTALCARALLAHRGRTKTVERAADWLRAYVKAKEPADANGWSSAYTLEFLVDYGDRKTAQAAADVVAGGQGKQGAWSYSLGWGNRWKGGFGGWPETKRGRYHSMNTAPCLVALARAKQAGIKVDGAVLERGVAALRRMRDAPGVFTYTWPDPRNFNKPDQSIARAPCCEQALLMLGATKRIDLKTTLGYFLRWKDQLRRPTKVTAGWVGPHRLSGYFYFFAYHHAAEALRYLGDKQALATLQQDLRGVAESDGTWMDWANAGKPYATAMALLVLARG